MTERKMCIYCGKWHGFQLMTPLYEQGKIYVAWYCEGCYQRLKVTWQSFHIPVCLRGEKKAAITKITTDQLCEIKTMGDT
ncbi:hypothetical protein [Peribacillus simplex]|uniref:hypothetical protein n=1 Tax=Peribacillus simplex TaxID=1478 RepID=UPI000970E240|nr:hypothetical protein [Peribacillus simplex]